MLVVATVGASARARPARRRRKAQPAEPDDSPTMPLTRVTAIEPERFGNEAEARDWLAMARAEPEVAEAQLDEGLRLINRALHAQRTAAWEPALADARSSRATAARIGWGTGEQLADSRWTEAIELPPGGPRRRSDTVGPQERVAAVLGGREAVDLCETLLLRARGDLDAGRLREAAVELRAGVEAMIIEIVPTAPAEQYADLEVVESARPAVAGLANEALQGVLAPERADEIAEVLAVCERVLRRRALLREE